MNRRHQTDPAFVFAPKFDMRSNDPAVLRKALMHMEAQVCHMRRRLIDIQKRVSGKGGFDPVAGILNRSGFLDNFSVEVYRMQNHESFGGTLILADMDNFDDIHRKHGRYVLSLCIRQVADVMMDDLGHSGEVAYIGEGEFAVLLPDIKKDEIIGNVQFLQSKLDRICFEWNAKKVQVKSSIGVHAYSTPDCMSRLLKTPEHDLQEGVVR